MINYVVADGGMYKLNTVRSKEDQQGTSTSTDPTYHSISLPPNLKSGTRYGSLQGITPRSLRTNSQRDLERGAQRWTTTPANTRSPGDFNLSSQATLDARTHARATPREQTRPHPLPELLSSTRWAICQGLDVAVRLSECGRVSFEAP